MREVLLEVGFTDRGVVEHLGVEKLHELREDDPEQLAERTAGGTPLETLIRLLLMGSSVPVSAAERAISPGAVGEWAESGFLELAGSTCRSQFQLLPFQEFYVAFDWPEVARVHHEAEYVMGLGSSTLTLSTLTVRRRSRATLDLGSGCGILALLATAHSDHVVAADRNPRAVALASFNAQLNAVASIECVQGDRFEPVRGRRFDLIVTNPPFVISPSKGFNYRDGGERGDGLVRSILEAAPDALEEGGYCHVLCNWAHFRGEDWKERLASWVQGRGCDAWVVCTETREPNAYASTWIGHTEGNDPERLSRLYGEWMAYYDEEGIEAMSSGFVTLRRRTAPDNWFRVENAPTSMIGPCGPDVARTFEACTALKQLPRGPEGDRALLSLALRISPSVRLEQTSRPAGGGWEPMAFRLQRATGFGYAASVDPLVRDLVGGCDGQTPLSDLVARVAEQYEADPLELATATARVVRPMIEQGFLELPRPPGAPETEEPPPPGRLVAISRH